MAKVAAIRPSQTIDRFGRRRDAADDRAQHRADQCDRRQDHAHELAPQVAAAEQVAFFLRHRRHQVRAHHAEDEEIDDVDTGQHQARDHGRREQRPDRFIENVGEQDENEARRDNLAERARGADHSAGEALVVAAPQQRRQGEQAERHHGRADDASGRAHQHADHDDADAEPAAQVAGGVRDHLHQIFGQPRLFEHHAHEHEQWHGDQRVVGHHAEDTVGQQIEQAGTEADIAENQSGGGERESHRNAGHQKSEERHQHQQREQLVEGHQATLRQAK